MLRLVRDGKACETAPYRLTMSEVPYSVDATAGILVEQAPDRLLWGGDWPHTFIKRAYLFDVFARWVPDAKVRQEIVVTNPAKVYEFPSAAA